MFDLQNEFYLEQTTLKRTDDKHFILHLLSWEENLQRNKIRKTDAFYYFV